MSLYVGEAGDSGMSGSSSPSASSSLLLSSPSRGGAPRAADARWRGLGRGVSSGNTLRDTILGGHSGRGAAAGVVGVEVLKVLTDTSSSPNVVTVEISLRVSEKLTKADIAASTSISSSSAFKRTFLVKGETEWGRTTPLPFSPEVYPSSGNGGAEGCGPGGGVQGGSAG